MPHLELLQTIAALSITLLGFSGIVATTGRLMHATDDPYTPIALNSMITPTLIALGCSFCPELASMLTASAELTWRASNAILGIAIAVTFLPMLARGEWANFQPVGKFLLTPVVLVALLGQLGAAVGLIGATDFVFVGGLLVQLMVGIVSFLGLVQLERRVAHLGAPGG
jgi:hypothetical protein